MRRDIAIALVAAVAGLLLAAVGTLATWQALRAALDDPPATTTGHWLDATGGGIERIPPPLPPACLDHWDDDGDGLTDFPADPGCADSYDEFEEDDHSGIVEPSDVCIWFHNEPYCNYPTRECTVRGTEVRCVRVPPSEPPPGRLP